MTKFDKGISETIRLILLFGPVCFVLPDSQSSAPQLVHVLHHGVQDRKEDEQL
jgi:hypothetical protein